MGDASPIGLFNIFFNKTVSAMLPKSPLTSAVTGIHNKSRPSLSRASAPGFMDDIRCIEEGAGLEQRARALELRYGGLEEGNAINLVVFQKLRNSRELIKTPTLTVLRDIRSRSPSPILACIRRPASAPPLRP